MTKTKIENEGCITLENRLVRYAFETSTGSLVQIEDLRTGCRHLREPADGRLFKIIAPDENGWLERHCESHAARPAVSKDGSRLTLHYDDVPVAKCGGSSGISVTVVVELSADSEEALFSIEVANRSPHVVHEVWFPRIGGWRGYSGRGKDQVMIGAGAHLLDPHNVGERGNPFTMVNFHRRNFFPAKTMMLPMMDISGGGRGLSFLHYPTKPRENGVVWLDQNERREDGCRPEWSWVHYPFIKPGGTWKSDPVGISCHSGDWHATADRMRTWLAMWWKAPEQPQRLRGSIGNFNLFSRFWDRTETFPLEDMPGEAAFCKAHGIHDFILWDNMEWLYIGSNPELFEAEPERLEKFRRTLKAIRGLGMQVMPVGNTFQLPKDTRLWKEFGEGRTQDSLYGYPVASGWRGGDANWRGETADIKNDHYERGNVFFCHGNPEYQRFSLSVVEKALDMGFNSYMLDQGYGSGLCFNEQHGHETPAHMADGSCKWMGEAARMVRERDSGAYTVGENPDMWNMRVNALYWNWFWCKKPNPEVIRYVLPEALHLWCIDAFEHEDQVGRAFALGFLLAIHVCGLVRPLSLVPDFAARIKRLAALRRKTEAFTVGGRLLDNIGLTVETGAALTTCLYQGNAAYGIVLGETAPYGAKGGGSVNLELDLAKYGAPVPASIRLHREDGSDSALPFTAADGKIRVSVGLQRWECAVLEIR